MGSYANIMGEDLKVTGLLVQAAGEIGIDYGDDGSLLFDRQQAQQILGIMLRDLQTGRTLVDEEGKVASRTLGGLEADAHMASALIDWLCNSTEDHIFFG